MWLCHYYLNQPTTLHFKKVILILKFFLQQAGGTTPAVAPMGRGALLASVLNAQAKQPTQGTLFINLSLRLC